MDIDVWQMMGSLAAMAFLLGFIDQLRITWTSKNVEGLSLIQWLMFCCASTIFTFYYAHLDQWLMFVVSWFGSICCLLIVLMIVMYRRPHRKF